MILELLESMQAGSEIGSAVGELFDSKHADDYNRAIEIYRAIDFENPNEKEIRDALYYFNKVDDDDKLYVRCWTWYNLAFCHALLINFPKAYSCLDNVERAETDFFTMKKGEIQDTKDAVPEARKAIKEAEAEWKAEQERIRLEAERKKKEEERLRKELEKKYLSSGGSPEKERRAGLSIPIVILIVFLVAIIAVLISYIIFNK